MNGLILVLAKTLGAGKANQYSDKTSIPMRKKENPFPNKEKGSHVIVHLLPSTNFSNNSVIQGLSIVLFS